MRLLYSSDLHGGAQHYARLVEAGRTESPDVVILGGDLLPDDSAIEPQTLGRGQPDWVRTQFRQAMAALRDACRPQAILVLFGNHDWSSSVTAMRELAEQGLVAVLDRSEPVEVNGVRFIGYACTPPTPWYVKDFERLDVPGDRPPLLGGARWDPRFGRASSHSAEVLFDNQPTMADELADLRPPARPWVFVAHSPPFNTKLDQSFKGESWGSKAVRQAIESWQPLLSLHGHVHESPAVSGAFVDRLGATLAVNVGQTHNKLVYAAIELDVAAGKVGKVDRRQLS